MKRLLTVGLLALCAVVTVEAQTDVWRSDSLQEVVVTGTGTQHLLKNAPVQTEVITNKMLRQYGGKSLEDILSGLTASFAFNDGDIALFFKRPQMGIWGFQRGIMEKINLIYD